MTHLFDSRYMLTALRSDKYPSYFEIILLGRLCDNLADAGRHSISAICNSLFISGEYHALIQKLSVVPSIALDWFFLCIKDATIFEDIYGLKRMSLDQTSPQLPQRLNENTDHLDALSWHQRFVSLFISTFLPFMEAISDKVYDYVQRVSTYEYIGGRDDDDEYLASTKEPSTSNQFFDSNRSHYKLREILLQSLQSTLFRLSVRFKRLVKIARLYVIMGFLRVYPVVRMACRVCVVAQQMLYLAGMSRYLHPLLAAYGVVIVRRSQIVTPSSEDELRESASEHNHAQRDHQFANDGVSDRDDENSDRENRSGVRGSTRTGRLRQFLSFSSSSSSWQAKSLMVVVVAIKAASWLVRHRQLVMESVGGNTFSFHSQLSAWSSWYNRNWGIMSRVLSPVAVCNNQSRSDGIDNNTSQTTTSSTCRAEDSNIDKANGGVTSQDRATSELHGVSMSITKTLTLSLPSSVQQPNLIPTKSAPPPLHTRFFFWSVGLDPMTGKPLGDDSRSINIDTLWPYPPPPSSRDASFSDRSSVDQSLCIAVNGAEDDKQENRDELFDLLLSPHPTLFSSTVPPVIDSIRDSNNKLSLLAIKSGTQHVQDGTTSPTDNSTSSTTATSSSIICRLCSNAACNPCVSTGGYVFCYLCIIGHIRGPGFGVRGPWSPNADPDPRCPVTGVPCTERDIIRLYEGDEDAGGSG